MSDFLEDIRLEVIRRTFEPIRRPGHRLPDCYKRSAVEFRRKFGRRAAAYIFRVAPNTLADWRRQLS